MRIGQARIRPVHAEPLIFPLNPEILLLGGELEAGRPGVIGVHAAGVDQAGAVDPQLRGIGEGDGIAAERHHP
jgi:hypothetical protein